MDKETKKEFENLAHMVARGFSDANKQFQGVNERIGELDNRLSGRMDKLDKRIGNFEQTASAHFITLERDVAEIRAHFVYREEFEDLMARVKPLERKAGIKSGK